MPFEIGSAVVTAASRMLARCRNLSCV